MIDKSSGKPLLFSLSGKYLTPIRDRRTGDGSGEATLELPKMDKVEKAAYYEKCVKSGSSGDPKKTIGDSRGQANNRSSVKLAYLTFVRQFKEKLAIKSDEDHTSPKDILSEMDVDGNGLIDKREMLVGAHALQISMRARELELIWPLFGPFEMNESINLDTFIDTFLARETKLDIHTHKAMDLVQADLRNARIRQKTVLTKRLVKLATNLRMAIVRKLKVRGIAHKYSFAVFDTDGGGSIDKQEFHEGLDMLGVDITDAELDDIWPLFSVIADPTTNWPQLQQISRHEWRIFLMDKADARSWSYKLTEDRFSDLIAERGRDIPRTAKKAHRALQEKGRDTPIRLTSCRSGRVQHAWRQGGGEASTLALEEAKMKRSRERIKEKGPPPLCGTRSFRKVDIGHRNGHLTLSPPKRGSLSFSPRYSPVKLYR
jgi:Ca2+-binding EF-hand superfamily protein